MDKIVIHGSAVPVGHAILAQSWETIPYSMLVDPLHTSHAFSLGASWSLELVLQDSCDVQNLETPRVKVDEHHVLFLRPGRPEYLIRRHDWGAYDA